MHFKASASKVLYFKLIPRMSAALKRLVWTTRAGKDLNIEVLSFLSQHE